MAGWTDATEGWESTTEGWASGAAAVVGTRRGSFMGTNGYLDADHLDKVANVAKVRYLATGEEVPWYLSTPDDTGSSGTLDVSSLAADIALAHSYMVDGAPVSVHLKVMGVPRKVNPFAGSADPASNGNWHWYALDSTGRTAMASYAVSFAALLDPTKGDLIEIGNEPNIPSFNHDGNATPSNTGASPATVAAMYAEQILAIRSAYPSLKIVLGSIANRGDINNPGDTGTTGPDWLRAMLTAEPRLYGTAKPDYWGYHPYMGSTSPLAGWQVVDGAVSNIPSGQPGYGTGWGMPQMIAFRDVLREFGVTRPGGGDAQISVTEFGTYWGLPGYSEALQLTNLQQYLYAFDVMRADGWLAGPELQFDFFNPVETGQPQDYAIYGNTAPFSPRPAATYYEYASQQIYGAVTPPVGPDAPVNVSEPLTISVEIGVPPNATLKANTFQLNHATRGKLNGSTVLDEPFDYVPVTGDVVSVETNRGVDQTTDATEAGTLTVEIRNDRSDRGTAGDYDVLNWASPFFPYLGPRSRMRVTVDGTLLFTGDISSVDQSDTVDGDQVVTTFSVVDTLGFLAKTYKYKPEAEHTAGRRLERLLERARVRDATFCMTGVTTFQAGTLQKAAGIDMANDVALGDGGRFYANTSGTYVYLDRAFIRDAIPVVTFSDQPSDEIRYREVERANGLETLYNVVTIDGVADGDEPAHAADAASASVYGHRELSLTLPLDNEFWRAYRAGQLVADYAQPRPHLHRIVIPTSRYKASERRTFILSLDLGMAVTVVRTPPGDVAPATISQDLTVIGVSHRIDGVHSAETVLTLAPKPL